MDRLQAEANRLSAEVGNTAAPIADKLSAGVSNLPEVSLSAGSSVGSRLSQLSGSFAAKLSASVRSVSVQIGTVKDGVEGATADLGSTAAGGLAEALGRGVDKVLPAVGEAGRVVKDGASTLSKAAAGGVPVVQEQTSALSSQIGSAVGGAGKTLNEGVSKLSQSAADGLPAVQDQVSVLASQVRCFRRDSVRIGLKSRCFFLQCTGRSDARASHSSEPKYRELIVVLRRKLNKP